jgi:hypothetical protein
MPMNGYLHGKGGRVRALCIGRPIKLIPHKKVTYSAWWESYFAITTLENGV